MKPFRPLVGIPALSAVLGLPLIVDADPPPVPSVRSQPVRLSPAALQRLVTGVAMCPDVVVELILEASQHPLAVHRAAASAVPERGLTLQSQLGGRVPDCVERLRERYPDILSELDRNLVVTGLLGHAYEDQPEAVWLAIMTVRGRIAELAAAAPATTPGDTTQPPAVWAAAAVARRLTDPAVLSELMNNHDADAGSADPALTTNPAPSATEAASAAEPATANPSAATVSHSRKAAAAASQQPSPARQFLDLSDSQLTIGRQVLQRQFATLNDELNRRAGTRAHNVYGATNTESPRQVTPSRRPTPLPVRSPLRNSGADLP